MRILPHHRALEDKKRSRSRRSERCANLADTVGQEWQHEEEQRHANQGGNWLPEWTRQTHAVRIPGGDIQRIVQIRKEPSRAPCKNPIQRKRKEWQTCGYREQVRFRPPAPERDRQ